MNTAETLNRLIKQIEDHNILATEGQKQAYALLIIARSLSR